MIIQTDLSGYYITTHKSKTSAAKTLGVDESTIRRAVKFDRKVMGKFKFYESNSTLDYTPIENTSTEVLANIAEVTQTPRVLILDIETAPIKAYTWGLWKQNIFLDQIISNFFIISWAAKWLDEDEVFGLVLTPNEILKEKDKNILIPLWELLEEADIVVAHNGCVARGNRVLKSDFTWVNVENLIEGDSLIAFEETTTEPNKPRKYALSIVEKVTPIIRECSEIEFEDGEKLIATNDHPWLTHYSDTQKHWKYVNTDQVQDIGFLTTVLTPWEKDTNQYHAGYLAGFFDADGCLSQHQRKGRENGFTFSITFAQKDPLIINKLSKSLDFYKFEYSITSYDRKHSDIKSIRILGGISEKLRFLGIVCPEKLNRLDLEKFNQLKMCSLGHRKIKNVTAIGKHEVIGLQTSSSTYIVEGMPCHNTKFDMPKINSRFLVNDILPPSPYKQIDTLKISKNVFGFSSNKLEALARQLGFEGKFSTDMQLWVDCMEGSQVALLQMLEYNEQDVIVLENVFNKLKPYAKGFPNMNLYNDEDYITCPHCNSKHLHPVANKYFYTNSVRYQLYTCNDCGAHSRSKKSIPYINKKQIISIPR